MAYNVIFDTQVDQDAPITTELGYQFRDNPIAIAAGDYGAPVVSTQWHPYNMVSVGDGNDGEIWSFSSDGAQSSIVTPLFVDGYEYAIRINGLSVEFAVPMTIDLFKETDSSYETCYTSTALSGSGSYYGVARVALPRERKLIHSIVLETAFGVDGAGSGFDMVDSTLQKISRARLSMSSGDFNGGSVHLLRRREFITG